MLLISAQTIVIVHYFTFINRFQQTVRNKENEKRERERGNKLRTWHHKNERHPLNA